MPPTGAGAHIQVSTQIVATLSGRLTTGRIVDVFVKNAVDTSATGTLAALLALSFTGH